MARSLLSPFVVATAALAAPLLLVGCEPPAGTIERAPEAVQLTPFREDTTKLAGFTLDGQSLFLETARGTAMTTAEIVKDVSLVDVASGGRNFVASNVLKYSEDASFGFPPAFVTVAETSTRGFAASVAFADERPPVMIDGLLTSTCCDPLGVPWAMLRMGSAGSPAAFWLGSYDKLTKVDQSFQIRDWTRDFGTGAFLMTAAMTAPVTDPAAAGGTGAGPLRYGIWSFPFDGSAPSIVLGPELGPVIPADGTEPVEGLISHSLNDGSVALQTCWSPGDWSTRLDFGIAGTACYAVYQRTLATKARLFVHDYAEPTERLLPGIAPTTVASSSWNGRWLTWWAPSTSGDTSYTLFVYDLETRDIHQCATGAPGTVMWQTGEPGAVIVAGPAGASEIRVWDLVSPTCPVVAMATKPSMILSPDGQTWAWLETDLAAGSKITLAPRDFSSTRVIAQGTYFQQIGFLDNKRMLIWRTNLDGFGYSWIDTSLPTPVEHALAEQVFYITSLLDAHQILVGHRYSDQDENGDISLIDMDTGAERLISHGVKGAAVRFEASADGGKTHLLDIAFLVKGRYASSQDGLWMAKLPFSISP